jgi:hypothetical protein
MRNDLARSNVSSSALHMPLRLMFWHELVSMRSRTALPDTNCLARLLSIFYIIINAAPLFKPSIFIIKLIPGDDWQYCVISIDHRLTDLSILFFGYHAVESSELFDSCLESYWEFIDSLGSACDCF